MRHGELRLAIPRGRLTNSGIDQSGINPDDFVIDETTVGN
jgi:hypothetical protein